MAKGTRPEGTLSSALEGRPGENTGEMIFLRTEASNVLGHEVGKGAAQRAWCEDGANGDTRAGGGAFLAGDEKVRGEEVVA